MTDERADILVVDDDVDFLEWSRCVLESAGYRVSCLPNTEAACAALDDAPPRLIVSDLMMESLHSGFSFARRVKESAAERAIPVIMVTAAASQRGFDMSPQSAQDLAAMHVDAFFSKPVPPEQLLTKVQELLDTTGAPEAGKGEHRE